VNILKRLRVQDAVYWAPGGVDAKGRSVYAEPVAIKCRWIDKAELFIMPDGSQGVSKSFVDMDRLPKLDGVLARGKLKDLPASVLSSTAGNNGLPNPLKWKEAWKIRATPRVPGFRVKDDTDPNKTLLRAIL